MDEKRNFFRRVSFTCVAGISIAKLSYFSNPIIMSFGSFIMIMALKNYNIKLFFEKSIAMLLGLTTGVLITEIFSMMPFLESILVYTIFLTALKLFSHRYKTNTVFLFVFTFMYSTIFASYKNSGYDVQVQQFFWEMLWVFIIVSIAFILYPSNIPQDTPLEIERSDISNKTIMFFAFILTAVWNFSMFYEWRFAYFAYVALISLFQDFELETMKRNAFENIKVNFIACSLTGLFSLVLYGIISNILLLILGLLVLFIPFIYKGVYSYDPKVRSVSFGIVSGLMFPLTIYLNISGAAIHDSLVRSIMITFLMIVILIVFNFFPNKEKRV